MSWFKVYNLFRQPAPRNAATIDKYLPFGSNDAFPLEWAKAVSDSPSASSCLSTIKDFIEGFGFSDTNLEKLVVNSKGETLWQIHQKTVDDGSQFYGFYWLLRYNALGTPTEWEVLPFQNCRLGIPDSNGYISKIHYNPFFGTSEYKGKNKDQTIVYDVYNPSAVKQQIADQKGKFKGQVFVGGNPTTLSPYYPINEAVSSTKWMKIESGVSDYHEDNLNNGFLQPFMLVMRGNPSDPSTNPDYNNPDKPNERPVTVSEEFDDVISRNFMGAKRVGNMFVQWVNNGEEAPTAVALPANNNGDLFVTLDNQATKKITVAWKVPGILANISEGVSLGGDGNAVRVAVKLMQQRVIKKQRVLTDNYQKILKNFITPYTQDITIVPYNPYPEMEILDDKIWNALSEEEQREWINDNTEIEVKEETELIETGTTTVPADDKTLEAQAGLRGSVGGVQGVLQIQQGVVDGTTTVESALSIMTIIYGFTDSEARQLLGQPEDIPSPNTEQAAKAFVNTVPILFNEKIKQTVKKALEYQDKMGLKCSGKAGREVSQMILDNKSMGLKQLKRIHGYLKKNEANNNKPFNEGCNVVLYNAWGGKDMENFLEEELKRLNAWLN